MQNLVNDGSFRHCKIKHNFKELSNRYISFQVVCATTQLDNVYTDFNFRQIYGSMHGTGMPERSVSEFRKPIPQIVIPSIP